GPRDPGRPATLYLLTVCAPESSSSAPRGAHPRPCRGVQERAKPAVRGENAGTPAGLTLGVRGAFQNGARFPQTSPPCPPLPRPAAATSIKTGARFVAAGLGRGGPGGVRSAGRALAGSPMIPTSRRLLGSRRLL